MVSLDAVRANNSNVKGLGPGLVAVFVGGTSGIGETTAREFVRNAVQPRVYLVGRNEAQATSIIDELQKLNPDGQLNFIKSDVSLLGNVDKACDAIKAKEESINLLFMSAGILTTKGRDETAEGLDKKFSLHYYSRMRFTVNLLPLLTRASEAGRLSRVITVLAAGTEGRCKLDDLSLKHNYTLGNCATHAGTMNSFAVEELAAANPATAFIHASPGIVKTNIMRDSGFLMTMGAHALTAVLKPWVVPLDQCGERHVYAATSPAYPPKAAQPGDDSVTGSAGVKGSGAYLINWDGTPNSKEKIMTEYRAQGVGKKIWDHTMDVFDKVCGSKDGKY